MLITPQFELDQNETELIVQVKLPYIRAKDIDYLVDEENTLRIHCLPYFLRLLIPGQVLFGDGSERASYDYDKGLFVLTLQKLRPGLFQGLDMLTTLIAKPPSAHAPPPLSLVAPLGPSLSAPSDRDVDYDWEIEQDLPSSLHPSALQPSDDGGPAALTGSVLYGFNLAYSRFFEALQFQLSEIVDIPDPDRIPVHLRHTLRQAREAHDFSPDHYMADFMDDSAILDLIGQPPLWWQTLYNRVFHPTSTPTTTSHHVSSSSSSSPQSIFSSSNESNQNTLADDGEEADDSTAPSESAFLDPSSLFGAAQSVVAQEERRSVERDAAWFEWSEEERVLLVSQLHNREYLLQPAEEKSAILSLVDLVFAYAYDHRTTGGEPTVESAWTIAKLSATLSWFCGWTSLHKVMLACLRRALVYPLYRHWRLALLALQDTYQILTLGRRAILKCLLGIRLLLEKSDQRYYLNRLYIDHYCVWIQQLPVAKLRTLPRGIKWYQPQKMETGWDLQSWEDLAQSDMVDESPIDNQQSFLQDD